MMGQCYTTILSLFCICSRNLVFSHSIIISDLQAHFQAFCIKDKKFYDSFYFVIFPVYLMNSYYFIYVPFIHFSRDADFTFEWYLTFQLNFLFNK
jgi:hypothetical protein